MDETAVASPIGNTGVSPRHRTTQLEQQPVSHSARASVCIARGVTYPPQAG